MRPSEARRRRSKKIAAPSSAPLARTRSRSRTVSSRMGRAERHVCGVGARETSAGKTRQENTREAGGRGDEGGVARVCDDKRFQDYRTGEGGACVRERDGHPGPTGRCALGTWRRFEGGATIEATSTSSTWADANEIGRPCARAVMRTCRAEGHGLPMGLSPVHAVSARQRKSSCRRRFLVSERRREAP